MTVIAAACADYVDLVRAMQEHIILVVITVVTLQMTGIITKALIVSHKNEDMRQGNNKIREIQRRLTQHIILERNIFTPTFTSFNMHNIFSSHKLHLVVLWLYISLLLLVITAIYW